MLYLETNPSIFVPWTGEAIAGIVHPRDIGRLWSEQALAEVGLYKPAEPAVPDGKVVTDRTVQRVGGVVTWVYTLENAPPPTPEAVYAERGRRLATGFDYDFGDARGVHRIGTSEADMIGWNDVTTFASALLALGDTTTPISIITDTGLAQVTALEWQQILVAAAAFRQPIWAASFALQAMQPIPADYADNAYWPA